MAEGFIATWLFKYYWKGGLVKSGNGAICLEKLMSAQMLLVH
jgi:hypothetical protein